MISVYSENIFQFDTDISEEQPPEVWYPAVLNDPRTQAIINANLADGWMTETNCSEIPKFGLFRFK